MTHVAAIILAGHVAAASGGVGPPDAGPSLAPHVAESAPPTAEPSTTSDSKSPVDPSDVDVGSPLAPPADAALPPDAIDDEESPADGRGTEAAADEPSDDAAPVEPAVPAALPPRPPAEPAAGEPRAWGGDVLTPLPEAPPAEDPGTLTQGVWRGRGWFGLGLAVSVPLGGARPAAGDVVGAVGEATLGWRLRPWLAIHSSISTFAHDSERRTFQDLDGTAVEEVDLSRITAFDLATARWYWPRPRRIEPWAEAGAGVGIRRTPFDGHRQAAGLVRAGLGVDFWLAPIFTLGVSTAYRLTIIDKAVGHGLRAGAEIGIHW